MMSQNTDWQLPDDAIEALRQLLDDSDRYQFAIGDLVSELVAEYAPIARRAEVIRRLASRVGCEASTLRDRQCMAAFFPLVTRQEFNMLTFSQLRACKAAGDNWRYYAVWACENLPAPVALIRAQIKHNGHLPPAWAGRYERLVDLAVDLADDNDAPPGVRLAGRVIGLGLFLARGGDGVGEEVEHEVTRA